MTPILSTSQPEGASITPRIIIDAYLQDNCIEFKIVHEGDVTKYVIKCPFNPAHTSSYIAQLDSGDVLFACCDNNCGSNNWDAVTRKLGKPKGIHYDPPQVDRREEKCSHRVATGGQEVPAIYQRSYDTDDLNDIGNARHFAKVYQSDLRYCGTWKKWFEWDGARWKICDGLPMEFAKKLVGTMFDDSRHCRNANVVFEHAKTTAHLSRLKAMITLAATEMPICVDELDKDPWILNCRNGVVDLRSGELKPHDRTQGVTKVCPTEFNPDAQSPVWNQFLSDVFGDEALIRFIQRLFGYFLTGDVCEQILPIFVGSGANGKSTLLNAFLNTIGPDYTMQCLPDFLMEKKGESHPTEKASLFGKRFVVCAETEASRKLAESMVKLLTGGERIMARRMREDFGEFNPTHKLVLCTNHLPIISGTDRGIWRRLLLVRFLRQFDGARQDKKLPDKLKAEQAGILAWAVRGCLQWQQMGLNPPDSVCNAADDYRRSEDIVGRFIDDCCVVSSAAQVRFSGLYQRFQQWAKDAGVWFLAKRKVGEVLVEKGFEKYTNDGIYYRGLMLRATNQSEGDRG